MMNAHSRQGNARWGYLVTVGIIGVAIFTAILFFTGSQSALADAGGWPTSTSTPTLAPTATFTTAPTSSLLLVPQPELTETGVIIPLTDGQALLQAQAPTPIPIGETQGNFSILACWPFALVIIVIAIVGIWWLRNRMVNSTPY